MTCRCRRAASCSFPALITDQLDISFPGVMPTTSYNPLVGQAQQLPVGLASLSVPALASLSTGIPAPGAPFRLGCGQGPPVTVDGHTYPTSVSGTVNDLTDFTPLPLHLCTKGAALTLSAGRHWLTSPGTGVPLAVTDLSLRASTASPAAAPSERHRSRPPAADQLLGRRIPHGDDRSWPPVVPGGSRRGQPGLDRHPQRAPAHAGDPGRLAAGLGGAGWRRRPDRHDVHPRHRIPAAAGRIGGGDLRADRGRGLAVATPFAPGRRAPRAWPGRAPPRYRLAPACLGIGSPRPPRPWC